MTLNLKKRLGFGTSLSLSVGADTLSKGGYERPSLDFAAAGDGVTDDTSAFNAWFADYDELVLRPGRRYLVSSRLDVIEKEIRLSVNGARIICPNGLMTVRQRTSYTSGPYFTTVEGADTFTIPVGVTVEEGDLITLGSSDTFQAVGDYKHGQWARVTDVTGGVATVTPAFYASFSVSTMRVVKPINPEIDGVRGGVIDMTGATEPATGAGLVGINLVGETPTLKNIRVLGNEFIGRGAFLEGMTPYAENSYFYGITNIKGQKDGSGNLTNSIEGYGLELDGDDCLAYRVTGENCKHPITAAQRTHTTRKVTLRSCVGISPLGAQAQTSDIPAAAPKYQGIDAHGNVRLWRVEDGVTRMVNTHYDCRAARTELINCTLVTRGVNDNFNNDLLINARENPADVYAENITVEYETPSGASDPIWLFGIQPWWAADHIGVSADGISMNENVGLFYVTPNGTAATANNFNIDGLSFENLSGSMTAGVKIVGHSPGSQFGNIGDITVTAAAGENVLVSGDLVEIDYVTSYGIITTSGLFNGLTDHSSLIDLPPTYGPNLVTNGDMSSGTGWTLGTTGAGASSVISGGVLTMSGNGSDTGYASQAIALSDAGTYKFSWDITNAATVSMRVGTTFLGSQLHSANYSTSTFVLVTVSSPQTVYISARKQTSGDGIVDNVGFQLQLTT